MKYDFIDINIYFFQRMVILLRRVVLWRAQASLNLICGCDLLHLNDNLNIIFITLFVVILIA